MINSFKNALNTSLALVFTVTPIVIHGPCKILKSHKIAIAYSLIWNKNESGLVNQSLAAEDDTLVRALRFSRLFKLPLETSHIKISQKDSEP